MEVNHGICTAVIGKAALSQVWLFMRLSSQRHLRIISLPGGREELQK